MHFPWQKLGRKLEGGEWFAFKGNTTPAGTHKIADIGMVGSIGMLQHIFAVKGTKTIQGFLLAEALQAGKGKQLTTTRIGAGFIYGITIGKTGRCKRIMGLNYRHGIGKSYLSRLAAQGNQEFGNTHAAKLAAQRQRQG